MSEKYKKKKSFYQKAKKFAQRGHYGKGQSLSKEEYNYYINLFKELKQLDEEVKAKLVARILTTMIEEKKVKDLATNQVVSRILDDILPLASIKLILPIMKVFSDDLRIMCADPFASHVLQTLLNLSLRYIQKDAKLINGDRVSDDKEEMTPVDDKSKEDFLSFLSKTSKFVYNNLEDFIHETYASHILRTVLEVCSGIEVSSSVKCSSKAQTVHSAKENSKQVLCVPDSLATVWCEIIDRLKQLPQFADVVSSDCGSAVLQTALLTSSAKEDSERISGLVSHIIEHGFLKMSGLSADVHPLFKCNAACRLMEVVVSVVSVDQQKLIYSAFFQEHMSNLATHEIGNYAVQRLFSSWKCKDMLSTLLITHEECLEEAFSCGNNGVLYAFVQACKNLSSCQSRCIKSLMKLLECYEPENSQTLIATLLLYFLKQKDYEEKKSSNTLPPISLYGTLIIQDLLQFKKPIKVVSSILEMPSSELMRMVSDPRGSHVTDVFMNSPFVGEVNRVKLMSKLEGHFVTLACSKHGSYSLESVWNSANVNFKTKICEELYKSNEKLKEDKFGVIIYNKFKLRFFNKRERKDWEEMQEKEYNKKEFLKRMLEETAEETTLPSPKKKKKEKKNNL